MDASTTDEPRQRKTSLTVWLLATLLLLIVAMVGFSLFGPNPPIEIGIATTRITTPLDANGLPDYAAVLLADSRKGVTPENNGAVPFLMAMWPEEENRYEFSAEEAKLLCAELDMPGVPPVEGRITSLYGDKVRLGALRLLRQRLPRPKNLSQGDLVKQNLEDENSYVFDLSEETFFNSPESNAAKDKRVSDLIDRCRKRTWTAEELPFLAEWLEENNTSLDRLVEAAERPEWHLPDAGLLRKERKSLMGGFPFNNAGLLSHATRLLTTRSRFFHGMENDDKAARDAMAILRLANHTSKLPLLADQLVATSLEGIGLELLDGIISEGEMSASLLHTLLTEFDQLGPLTHVADSLDQGERFLGLDTFVVSQSAYDFVAYELDLPTGIGRFSCDWNLALKEINNFYDAAIAASKLPTWTQRQAAYDQIDTSIPGDGFSPQSAQEFSQLLTAGGRGQVIGKMWVNMMGGYTTALYRAEERSHINRQLTRLGIALAIHRAEQGAYPESLNELVPSVLPKLPVDLFHKNPFAYHKTNEGYLLYSFGANGTDDRASNRGVGWGHAKLKGTALEEPAWGEEEDENSDTPYSRIPAGADDLSLRVPLPEPEPWPWEQNN